MTPEIYNSRQANDIVSRGCGFYFPEQQVGECVCDAGKPSLCQVLGRGESGNEGGRLVLFHRGDRCDRLTRPERTGCLLKAVTSLLRAPHTSRGPLWLSLHPVSTTAALITVASLLQLFG